MQTATVQMCSSPDVAANLASAHALLTQSPAPRCRLARLPEYCCARCREAPAGRTGLGVRGWVLPSSPRCITTV